MRRQLNVHRAERASHESEIADRDELVAVIIRHFESLDEHPISLEVQPRERLRVRNTELLHLEACVGRLHEAIQARYLYRAAHMDIGLQLTGHLCEPWRGRLKKADVD